MTLLTQPMRPLPRSILGIAADSWRVGIRAIAALPLLFATSFVANVAWEMLLTGPVRTQIGMPGVSGVLVFAVSQIGTAAIQATTLIAVHRLAILGERIDRPNWRLPGSFLRFWLVLGLLNMAQLPGTLVSLVMGQAYPVLTILIYWTLLLASTVVITRLSILLPAIAVASVDATVRQAWRNSRRHFWKIFVTALFMLIPLAIIPGVFIGICRSSVVAADIVSAMSPVMKTTLAAVALSALAVFGLPVGGVMASRFYQLYTPREPGPPA